MAVMTLMHERFSGPLPPAREFRGYEDVLPGAAARILGMAERNQAHRHAQESKVVTGSISSDTRGQNYALIALVLIMAVVTAISLFGHPKEGVALGIAITIAIVLGFLGQKFIPSKDQDGSGDSNGEAT